MAENRRKWPVASQKYVRCVPHMGSILPAQYEGLRSIITNLYKVRAHARTLSIIIHAFFNKQRFYKQH